MTSDSNLVCSRCGYSNVPGDVFCGSCGAFLEWEGQPAGAGGPAPSRDPDVPAVGAPAAASEAPTEAFSDVPLVRGAGGRPGEAAGGAPGAAPGAVPAPAAAPATGELVRCPVCGVANQAGRTFCQSCGSKLDAAASRVVAPTPEQIAAAVAATSRPPAQPTTAAAKRSPAEQQRSGGIGKWLVVIALLGVLAGIGFVVGTSLLKGPGPASDASTIPGSPGVAGQPSGADPSGATGSSGGGATDASSGPPPEPVDLALLGATASSVVGDLEKFQPKMAIDGDPATAWQEGAKQEKGQWIEVSFAPSTVSQVVIRNGYGASTALFRGNRRLKDVLISVDGGDPKAVRLKDTTKAQEIAVAGGPGATTLRITIVSTYAGRKTSVANTPFDDAAVSEIRVLGVPGS